MSSLLGETLPWESPPSHGREPFTASVVVVNCYKDAGLPIKKPHDVCGVRGEVARRCDKMNDTRSSPLEQVCNSVFAAEPHASRLVVVEVYPDVR